MNILDINYFKKDYPYSDESYDPKIAWGKITLSINSPKGELIKEVVKLEWDIREIINWLVENKEAILLADYPIESNYKDYSIAQKIFDFYNKEGMLDKVLLDKVFDYRKTHGLRFGLRGTDIDDIFIGKNGKKHEISFFNKKSFWENEIDLTPFFCKIEELAVMYTLG